MLVCLFVQTLFWGGWKSLKTCRNAKKKKILQKYKVTHDFGDNSYGHHVGFIGYLNILKIFAGLSEPLYYYTTVLLYSYNWIPWA